MSAPVLPSAARRFGTLVAFELLGGLRRRKVLAMASIAVALVAVQILLQAVVSSPVAAAPDYVVSIGRQFGSDIFSSPFILLFAIAVAMDVLPLEFESGTIATLLAEPVTRRMVFAAKWVGMLALLALIYALLFGLALGASWVVYGPQERLDLFPLLVGGSLLSILVYATLVFSLGAVFRSSLIAGIGGFGVVFALVFATFILAGAGHTEVVALPGPGPTVTVIDAGVPLVTPTSDGRESFNPEASRTSLSLGTHTLGGNLVYAATHPGKDVVFSKFRLGPPGAANAGSTEILLREPLDGAVMRSVGIAGAWMGGLLGVAWWAFRRTEALG